jgi:hypothetical protein
MSAARIDRARSILGVAPACSGADLRRAYRAGAKRLHPDRLGREASAADLAAMAELNAAYTLLADLPAVATPPPPTPGVRPPDRVIDVSHLFADRPRPKGGRGLSWPAVTAPPPAARQARVRRPVAHLGAPDPVDIRFEAPAAEAPGVDPALIVIPFGRYQGMSVAAVGGHDPAYLHWLLRAVSSHPEVRAAARAFVAERERAAASALTDAPPEPPSPSDPR